MEGWRGKAGRGLARRLRGREGKGEPYSLSARCETMFTQPIFMFHPSSPDGVKCQSPAPFITSPSGDRMRPACCH
jgi:hypothetical protein